MKKLLLLFACFTFSASLVHSQTQTIAEIIEDTPNLSTLNAALGASGLDAALAGAGPFTVFAPTNEAFAALPDNFVSALLTDPSGVLTDILQHHVASGAVLSNTLSDGQEFTSLFDQTLTINIDGTDVTINSINIIDVDIEGTNGVIHVIDAVLVPETTTIADVVIGSDVHTTLLDAVVAAELAGTLAGPGAFTVFAPTDAAFDLLPDGALQALLDGPIEDLQALLLYHVIDNINLSTDLSDGIEVMTLNGASVVVSIVEGNVFINDAQVTVADIVTVNGVVHVIDAVLMPAAELTSIFEIVAASEVHNTLEAALLAAELDGTLSGEGDFTLFAPTDEAFEALPANFVNALLTDPSGVLSDILLYHVVGSSAFSGDLSDGQEVITLFDGQSVTVTIDGGNVFINGAQVIIADIEATNGVVHVIDAVLVPETTTIADVVAGSDVHTTLLDAVVAAELAGTLAGPGAFTVFAPTDDAFDLLPDGVLEALINGPIEDLQSILLYHVVDGIALSTDLSDGQDILTINGQLVNVSIEDGDVFINNAQVTVADIVTVNGVVHVIDAVLLPAELTSIFEIVAASDIHNTLEAALVAANLSETLDGEGNFTLFAPTDDAFAALPANFVNALLTDPEGVLSDILLYHVVGDVAFSMDLSNGQEIETLFDNQNVTVTINEEGIFINDAQVIVANLQATNGVVHVIDAVLVPQTTTIADVVAGSSVHTTLLAGLEAAELDGVLAGPGAFTVFAPTDAAFQMLPAGLLDELLADPTGDLANVLLYHVLDGIVLSSDLSPGQTAATLFGETITVTFEGENIFINDAQVTTADIVTVNGVVHVINTVLIPTTLSVDDNPNINSLSVYPNPASDQLNLSIDAAVNGRMVVNMLSVAGQTIKSFDLGSNVAGSSRHMLNVSGVPAGFYLLSIELNGTRSIEKVQVLR